MKPDVVATFEIAGSIYEDVNPLCRPQRVSGSTIGGVRPANADRLTMHAEFGAMLQAYDEGIRGGHGLLRIDGIKVCPWCKGDLKVLARAMSLEGLTVYDADGTTIEFVQPQDFLPVKRGGKAWN